MVKDFAEAHGITVQWARKLRKRNAPEWVTFCTGPKETAAEVPEGAPGPENELERAKRAMDMAWVLYERSAAAAEKGARVTVDQIALNRAAKEARDAYDKACKQHAAAQISAGQWVSVERVAAIRSATRRLEDVQNFQTVLAGKLPEEMRPAFHRAFESARPAWNDGVRAIDDYIQTLLPVPC
mgnify:CR=1 FL=1